LNPVYDHVYGGLNGIEGILNEKFVDLTNLSAYSLKLLKQTCSSALGSCRYKLKRDNTADFEKLFDIFNRYNIDTLFYIGGNDSMDTVAALSEYAETHSIKGHQFVGCPKTVDNDLVITDHTPGFASAAKYIAMAAKTTWLDLNVYTRKEVMIMETMGRDAGWLAGSACLSGKVDVLILPETVFDEEKVFERVKECIAEKNKCYIVVSEGARYANGTYLAAGEAKNDTFGHAVLGGAANVLKQKLLEKEITPRVKIQDMGMLARCNAANASATDVEEAYRLGMSAHMRSMDKSFTGKMVAIRRGKSPAYNAEYFSIDAGKVANAVKNVPAEWILPDYKGVTQEFIDYVRPLIQGEPELIMENGIPAQIELI
ncbi:MAG: diphosphate--fructose-6-phosphate 1-phosphotransferase, partial [Erysipelotrichaceae bacterium]|nr:diphosphate--fructose-6-phosphate 1-phosphotransferase [Erysipelotrichaceae bacterium]